MEENSIDTKHTLINVVIWASEHDDEPTAIEALNAFIDPDNNDARKFNFSFDTAGQAKDINYPNTLYIILGTTVVKPTGAPCITIAAEDRSGTAAKLEHAIASLEAMLDLGFTLKDFEQVYHQGTPVEDLRRQLVSFRNGISKIILAKPATLDNGIFELTAENAEKYANLFDSRSNSLTLRKFVPASGAASRMFKFLCEFEASFDPDKETVNAYINRRKDSALSVFLIGLEKFPFYDDLMKTLMQRPEYASWTKTARTYHLVKLLLSEPEFNYASRPKGVLPFHRYEDHIATPVCEHFKEAAAYTASNGTAHVHFTISEEHLDGFLDVVKEARDYVEKKTGITLTFDFSYQHKSTDTIAVDLNNKPFRENGGKLLFRPGGHGALIENLNAIDADIVFVKNIDNVSHNNLEHIALYKKALAGGLLELQDKVFAYLKRLEDNRADEALINEIFAFAEDKLALHIPTDVSKYTAENKADYAFQLLNRPIRVCGMVKNEGEPGGGPFWVKEDRSRQSLQIVESSQIDHENKEQAAIFAGSTHFNPVDLVCGIKDYRGNSFNLKEYIDHSTGFIVLKNRFGKDVKSYELPGLWNGAMAGWITIFVEVPLETFNPVKTVNDLLKPAHQPQ